MRTKVLVLFCAPPGHEPLVAGIFTTVGKAMAYAEVADPTDIATWTTEEFYLDEWRFLTADLKNINLQRHS